MLRTRVQETDVCIHTVKLKCNFICNLLAYATITIIAHVVHTWAGFKTTVLPAAKRGEIFHANIISG